MHPAVSRFSHKHLICNNEDGRSVSNRGNSGGPEGKCIRNLEISKVSFQQIVINPINKLKKELRVIRRIQILDRTFPFKILIKISTKRFVYLNIFLILFYAR